MIVNQWPSGHYLCCDRRAGMPTLAVVDRQMKLPPGNSATLCFKVRISAAEPSALALVRQLQASGISTVIIRQNKGIRGISD
jgi:hypothetical protein